MLILRNTNKRLGEGPAPVLADQQPTQSKGLFGSSVSVCLGRPFPCQMGVGLDFRQQRPISQFSVAERAPSDTDLHNESDAFCCHALPPYGLC